MGKCSKGNGRTDLSSVDTDRQTHGKTKIGKNRQNDRQTNRKTHTHTDTHTQTHTDTQTNTHRFILTYYKHKQKTRHYLYVYMLSLIHISEPTRRA